MDRQKLANTMRDLSIDSSSRLPLTFRKPPSQDDAHSREEGTKRKLKETKPSLPQPPRKQNRRSRAVSLEPRPFAELHNERSYLAVNLQRQNGRAENLMAELLQAEDQCSSAQTPAEARKLRKQAGRLRNSLAEAERQEKMILMRLSELYVEIQSRERWSLVHQRRQSSHAMLWQVDHPHLLMPQQVFSPVSPMTPLPIGYYNADPVSMTHPSPLSPLSPEFVPGAFSFRDLNWDANRSGVESPNYSPCWVREKECDNSQAQNPLDGWETSSGNNSRSLSTPTPSLPQTPERRLSLPTPDAVWPLE